MLDVLSVLVTNIPLLRSSLHSMKGFAVRECNLLLSKATVYDHGLIGATSVPFRFLVTECTIHNQHWFSSTKIIGL